MAKVSVRLESGMQAVISARHHTWLADEPTQDGGTDTGPMATEVLLGALASCVAITLRVYSERKGWPLEGVDVDVQLNRFKKSDFPAYTGDSDLVNQFIVRMTFHGPLSDEQKERLRQIAGKCPVHRILTQPNFFIEEMVEEPAST